MVDAPGNNHRRSSSSSSSEVSVDYELQVAGKDDASRINGNGTVNSDVTEPSPIAEAVEADTGRNSCSVSVSSGPVGQSLPEDDVSHNENDIRESSGIGEEVEASQTDTDHNSSYVSISSGSVGQSLPEDDFSHNGNSEVRESSSIREAVEASQTDTDHNLCSVSIASGSLGELLAQDDVCHNGSGHGNVRESSANREAAEASQMDTDHNAVSISPGHLGQSLAEQNISSVDRPTADTSVPTANQLVKHRGHRRKNSFSLLAAKVFDDNFPLKKKIKLLRKLASVKHDGTVQFEVPGDVKPQALDFGTGHIYDGATDEEAVDATDIQDIPPLQIVMLIVGTRGDVQPFVAIGKKLQGYGHRVRLATHSNFKEFVLAAGLEFFPLGGDPKVLAEYMVKNKGFLPSGPSEIPIQRNQMKEIIFSLLPACTLPDPDTKVPFQVDAIIANPPAYGHVHVAEALKVPIHIYFTMPWTPTSEFPHPLSRVRQPVGYRLSYQIVDTLIWLGIRDMINDFRKKKLKLRPVTYLSGSYYSPMEIPYGYIWSPHLVPKPKDWGPKIDVVGFCFLDLASSYVPPEALVKWLEAGTKPLYIGFGSLPVQEPEKMTQIIVEALELTGQRGIINKGWGGLGNLAEPKDFVYSLDNCPHDWLFLRCAAVVHHGGAGTTAAGLKAACPTTVVPFFGDQPFWGERVHARGVGPTPIPVEEFSLDKLVAAIRFMLDPEVKQRAVELAKAMENEDGVTGAVNAFYRHFPRKKVESDHDPDEVPRRRRSRLSISRCFTCTSS